MTRNQLLARLKLKGSDPSKFAHAHHYKARTVQQVIDRYVGKPDKRPRGILTYKILRDLSKAVGKPVIEGMDDLIN